MQKVEAIIKPFKLDEVKILTNEAGPARKPPTLRHVGFAPPGVAKTAARGRLGARDCNIEPGTTNH